MDCVGERVNFIKLLIIACFFILSTSCSSMLHIRYELDNINNAYMDKDKNLYICISGTFNSDSNETSNSTIMLPLSNNNISKLSSDFISYVSSPGDPSFYPKSEVFGLTLNSDYFSAGCLPSEVTSKMLKIRVVDNLQPPVIYRSEYDSIQDYGLAYNKKIKLYLNKMLPDDSQGVIYKLFRMPNHYSYGLIYAETESRFAGMNKIGFDFRWSEEGFSFVKTVSRTVTAPIAGFLYLESEILSN